MKRAVELASSPVAAPVAHAADVRSGRVADFLALTKPRINLLVVVTTLVGYYLGRPGGIDLWPLAHTVLGTLLVASGAAAFNQVLERDVDRLMRRTRSRPLPDGRVGAAVAGWFAFGLSGVGLAELALGANVLAAVVALVTLASYALVYTPLKRYTSLSTVIGAVPGALPPMIGWAAATGTVSIEGWILFGIVFFWQVPHVLAVSWMYREDYERGGIVVLPVLEPDGTSTSRQTVSYAAALLPVSLAPTAVALTGTVYFWGAALLSGTVLALAADFAIRRTRDRARRLFFATLIYLPALLGLMLADRL